MQPYLGKIAQNGMPGQQFEGLRGIDPTKQVAGAVGATPSALGTSSPMDQIAMGQINPNFVGA